MTDWERLLDPVPYVDSHVGEEPGRGSGSPVGAWGIADVDRPQHRTVYTPEMFAEYNRGVRRAVMANRSRDAEFCSRSGCRRRNDGHHLECWTCRHK